MAEMITDNYYALYTYLDTFWRRRYLIAVTILLTPFFVLLSTVFLSKTYQASISIAVNNVAPPSMKDFSSTVDLTEQFAGLQAYLSSPAVLKKVAIEAGLVRSGVSDKLIQQTTEELNKKLVIKQMEKNAISITLTQNSPNYLTKILNGLGDTLIEHLNEQNTLATQSSTLALETELAKQQQKVKSAIAALNEFENQHAESLPSYGEIYITRLKDITRERGDIEAQYNALVVETKELSSLLIKINPVIGQLENTIRDNDSRLAAMRLVYTDNYPGIKALIKRGDALRAERDKLYNQYKNSDEISIQQLWNMVTATGSGKNLVSTQTLAAELQRLSDMQLRMKGMTQKLIEYKKEQDELNKKLQTVGDTTQTLLTLKQAVKNNQAIFEDTQSRYNVTRLTATMNSKASSANFQVVAYPQKPISSLQRPRSFFLVLGIIAGVLLGFGLALAFEYMDNTVYHSRDVEALTDLQVICRVDKMSLA